MESLELANILYLTCCCAMVPIILFLQFCFYRLRQHPFLMHRRPNVVIWFAGFCAAGIICDRFLVILISQNKCCAQPFTHWRALVGFSSPFFINGVFWIVFYRLYLVWFDIKCNLALEDSQWRVSVNRNDTNWFLRHRSTFGNDKWVAIYCISWFTLSALLCGVILAVKDELYLMTRMISGFVALVAITHMVVILCKLPAYEDPYCIREEVKWCGIASALTVIGWFFLIIMLDPYPPSFNYLAINIYMFLGYWSPLSVSLIWVLKKGGLPISPVRLWGYLNEDMLRITLAGSHNTSSMIAKSMSDHRRIEISKSKMKYIGIHKILPTSDGFTAFARYLCSEYSVENLLFILEIVQYLDNLKQSRSDISQPPLESNVSSVTTTKINLLDTVKNVRFPANAPRSEIVYGQLQKNGSASQSSMTPERAERKSESKVDMLSKYNICEQTILLFEKYISNNADFCINIPSGLRYAMYTKMNAQMGKVSQYTFDNRSGNGYKFGAALLESKIGDIDNCQSFENIFDGCIIEIWKLLQQSHYAFRRTDGYQIWHNNHTLNNAREAGAV